MNENQNKYVDINAHDNYPDSEQKIEIPTMKVIPLKKICMTIGELPTSYLETMTYYEMLVWFINYLRNNIIPTINNNSEAVQEVQTVVLSLQNYINEYKDSIDSDVEELEKYMNNYFENLDVQEEINNKLDDMLKDGVLEQIIEQFLAIKSLLCFDNVAEMKLSTNITDGSYARTLGYYSKNDGGSSLYKIRTITNDDVVDEGSIIKLNNNNLIAELVVENNEVNVNQFGAKGDNVTDDTQAIQKAINFASSKGFKDVKLINYRYYCGSGLEITYPEFKLHGQPLTEYGNSIRFDLNVTIGIDVKNYGFKMENICLLTTKGTTNSVVGLRIVRPTGKGTYDEIENAMNLDADINNCSFLWLNTAIYFKGRNVNIDTCEFGECQNCIQLDKLAEGHSHRDIWIRNNRFHNIGVYQRETLGYEYGFAIIFPSVWTRADTYGNIIRNNFFDYCNNIFTGDIIGCTISDNNILDCLHNGIVAINPNEGSMSSPNEISVMISNNNINLRGSEANYGIYLKGVTRPRIVGNVITNQPTICLYLENCSTLWIADNVLFSARSDITEN